jgi:hypothetical protein
VNDRDVNDTIILNPYFNNSYTDNKEENRLELKQQQLKTLHEANIYDYVDAEKCYFSSSYSDDRSVNIFQNGKKSFLISIFCLEPKEIVDVKFATSTDVNTAIFGVDFMTLNNETVIKESLEVTKGHPTYVGINQLCASCEIHFQFSLSENVDYLEYFLVESISYLTNKDSKEVINIDQIFESRQADQVILYPSENFGVLSFGENFTINEVCVEGIYETLSIYEMKLKFKKSENGTSCFAGDIDAHLSTTMYTSYYEISITGDDHQWDHPRVVSLTGTNRLGEKFTQIF